MEISGLIYSNISGLQFFLQHQHNNKASLCVSSHCWIINQLAVTSHRSHAQVRSFRQINSSRPSSTNTMFLSLRFQASKILRNLQGKMGHAWSPGLTGTSALLSNLPHIRGINRQLLDFGHCSANFWPQGRDHCQGRLAPDVKIRQAS